MTLDWLTKRSLREGQVFAKIFYSEKNQLIKAIQLLKRISYLLTLIIIFPFALFLGKCKWVWILRKIMTNTGQISSLLNKQIYQEYK